MQRVFASGIARTIGLIVIGGTAIVAEGKSEKPAHSPETTNIYTTGEILGIAIGTSVKEAHKKLDPLRGEEEKTSNPKGKGKEGRREIWKLKETDFRWIMVWINEEDKITRIGAWLRREMPFSDIADLNRAVSKTDSRAMWNGSSHGKGFQLLAKGRDKHAQIIYLVEVAREKAD